jgi:elongation factor P hydroxylase
MTLQEINILSKKLLSSRFNSCLTAQFSNRLSKNDPTPNYSVTYHIAGHNCFGVAITYYSNQVYDYAEACSLLKILKSMIHYQGLVKQEKEGWE